MQNVDACPFCSTQARSELRAEEFDDPYIELVNPALNQLKRFWYECSECDFIYRSPKLSEEEQGVLYRKYREVTFREEKPDAYFDRISSYVDDESENHKKLIWLFSALERVDITKEGIKRALDVGSGGGVLLERLKRLIPDCKTFGIEPNEAYSDLARRRAGAEEIKTEWYSSGKFSEPFDLILCTDVLEHIDDTAQCLAMFAEDLNDDGILFIEIPSVSNFEHIKDPSHDIFNAAHHMFFPVHHLREYLSRAGFEVIAEEDASNVRGIWKLKVLAQYRG